MTLTLVILLGAVAMMAQGTSVFTTGLNNPRKIITAGQTSFLVAEAGTNDAPNTGRISLVNRTTGVRQTLIDNLPSGVNNLAGAPTVSGPSGLKLIDQTLYLTTGTGNAVMSGGPGGLESPNPNSSSQLFVSVMALTLPPDYETLASGFVLSAADQTTLAGGGQVTLTNMEGKQLTVRMVVNLPDFRSEPRPDAPNNVRSSNPYGIEASGDSLYVVDASFNQIHRVVIASGAASVFTTFAQKANPTPMGPPMVDAVPDSIRLVGDQFLVTYLTGFPFVQGLAEVRGVNVQSAAQSTFIPNLGVAIDVLPLDAAGAGDSYFVLEFSSNMLAQAPGRLKLFTSRTESPRILVSNLITPTSLARDAATGSIFVTETATGRIIRVSAPKAINKDYFGTGKSDFVSNTVAGGNIVWSVLRNPPGSPAQTRRINFGLATDTIVNGDFDGDLKQDIAVYREGTMANPQGYFYFIPSTNPNTFVGQPWGTTGDKPVTGDFDADGKTDFGIVRRTNNQIVWIILPSGGGAVRYVTFGLSSDLENPTAADFNGDGRDDLIVTRTSMNGDLTHYIGDASSGASIFAAQWGNNSSAPTTVFFGDYTGDSRADIAVNYGACNANPTCDTAGTWWILDTGSANYTVTKFGIPFNAQTMMGDRPTFGDWDGDGKTDISVFRPSNTTLYAITSSNGQLFSQFWNGDSATP